MPSTTNPLLKVWDATNQLALKIASALAARNSTGTAILPTATMAILDDTSPAAVTEDNLDIVRMSADRSLLVTNRSATGTPSNVAAATSNTALKAANAARKGITIYNDSVSATLFIANGFTASATAFSVAVLPGGYYEMPYGFVGAVNGIWSSAVGNARVTEYT